MIDKIDEGRLVRAIREGVVSVLDELVGFAFLESTDQGCERCRGKFELVGSKAREALRCVQNLLDMITGFVRVDEFETNRTFSLQELFDDLQREFGSSFRDRELEFVAFIEEDIKNLFSGSFQLIRRALSCLLDNSIKFTAPGGGLVLAVQRLPSDRESHVQLVFTLCDSGAGIPDEVRQRVMQPFRKADETLSGRKGMGLGLSVAAELIGRIGGTLELKTKVGTGTQIRFKINCIQHDQVVEEARESSYVALVVDDVIVNRTVLALMLQRLGWQVDQAIHGEEAVEMVKRNAYDVIFMDINMPVMNGVIAREVIEKLEQDLCRDKATPIVAHTTSMEADERMQYVAMGFRDLLPKPFSKAILQSVLRDLQFKT